VPATHVILEVTETVLMHGLENATAHLDRLRALGVTLSIDDFGTGYSSLNYLATLPIDDLKLDRSFIEQLCLGGNGAEIVKAVFRLGQALGKRVFAEGIETAEQLSTLQAMGCDFGQGFMLSRPMERDAVERMLAALPVRPVIEMASMADLPEKRTLH
jgi:EAL domain-containing protein (putative c-di-GMP-specific phosphodiesterase class I)